MIGKTAIKIPQVAITVTTTKDVFHLGETTASGVRKVSCDNEELPFFFCIAKRIEDGKPMILDPLDNTGKDHVTIGNVISVTENE